MSHTCRIRKQPVSASRVTRNSRGGIDTNHRRSDKCCCLHVCDVGGVSETGKWPSFSRAEVLTEYCGAAFHSLHHHPQEENYVVEFYELGEEKFLFFLEKIVPGAKLLISGCDNTFFSVSIQFDFFGLTRDSTNSTVLIHMSAMSLLKPSDE